MLLGLVAACGAFAAWCSARAARYDVAALARHVPKRTALMEQRAHEATAKGKRAGVDQRWVSAERVSPLLRRAVLIAEDDAFFAHGGLDWEEIRASAQRNLEKHRVVRGGSTITQQLARNLFLGDGRTPARKLTEAFLALRLERTLTKRRIFELYLNEIEWGNGVYGIEAAARRHFGVSASQLDARQAVLLAAVIINPRRFSPTAPPRRIERRARMIAQRMRRRGFLDEAQYVLATGAQPPAVILPPGPPGVPPTVWVPPAGDTTLPAPADVPAADDSAALEAAPTE